MGGPPGFGGKSQQYSNDDSERRDVTFCGIRVQYPSTHLSSKGNCKIPIKTIIEKQNNTSKLKTNRQRVYIILKHKTTQRKCRTFTMLFLPPYLKQ